MNDIDEALERPEPDHELIVEEVDADRNGGPVREQEVPALLNDEALDAEKQELHELTWNSSPLCDDESIRADDSWLKSGWGTSKPKKDKKMSKSNIKGL